MGGVGDYADWWVGERAGWRVYGLAAARPCGSWGVRE